MNILWINKITDTETWRTTQLGLTDALRRRGNKVILVMAKNLGEKKSTDENIIYLPTVSSPVLSGLFFGLIIFYYIPFFIKKNKTDIIIIDIPSIWLPFCLPLKLLNVPLLIDIRDFPEYNKKPILFDISIYLAKYLTNGITTISSELKGLLIKKYGIINKKIGIWSSGVSTDKFFELPSKNIFFNQKEPEKFVLMHHGSYEGFTRGIENLIISIALLDDSLKKIIELKIIGIPLEKQKKFLHLINELNLNENVKIMPRIEYNKMPSYIQTCDVGVIPLTTDKQRWQVSSPLKTLEYLSTGKPVIVTNIPFHRKLFEKGICGILIDTNDPKVLSDTITNIYKNREKLEIMGKTGRDIVKNYYTWDIIASQVETFLKNILADFRI